MNKDMTFDILLRAGVITKIAGTEYDIDGTGLTEYGRFCVNEIRKQECEVRKGFEEVPAAVTGHENEHHPIHTDLFGKRF